MSTTNKMGRPKSDKPLTIEAKARIDEETNKKLVEYCEKHNVTRTDVIREGIRKVIEEK
jgi:antitoxin component of RelBE/YafQ-DinJ toxin-antitoxin module